MVLLHLLYLPLEHIILCELGGDPLLFDHGGLLLVRDLHLGASPLAARLQQIGGDALVGYRK